MCRLKRRRYGLKWRVVVGFRPGVVEVAGCLCSAAGAAGFVRTGLGCSRFAF